MTEIDWIVPMPEAPYMRTLRPAITGVQNDDVALINSFACMMREALALNANCELKVSIKDGVIGFPEVTPISDIPDFVCLSTGEKLTLHPPGN